jgi:hypothetical protein
MSKSTKRHRGAARSRRASSQQHPARLPRDASVDVPWPFRPGETKWTGERVRQLLSNPVYGYGINLQPYDTIADAVTQLVHDLAERQRESHQPLSLDELDRRFQVLFADVVERGVCVRGLDMPPIISKEQWLHVQQTRIGRLARGEPE